MTLRPDDQEATVFAEPVFVANSLNVIFPRAAKIRRRVNEFEDRLDGLYGQPQTVPVPDELDPQVPRLVFQSLGGHSQLVVSQVSIAFTVVYDGAWTTDPSKRLDYLRERVPLVYDLCEVAQVKPVFTGLTGRVRLASDATDADVLARLTNVLGIKNVPADLSEVSLRLSAVVDGRFFNNITVQSYREWQADDASSVGPMPAAKALSRGVELIHDLNDRFAYNEHSDYETSQAAGLDIVTRAQDLLHAWVSRIQTG
jgi:hypothetical protein